MKKMRCPVCGLIYEVENLPEQCEYCQLHKSQFKVIEIDVPTSDCNTHGGIGEKSATSNREDNNPFFPHYVVLQVTLKEKLIGTSSANLSELEYAINNQAAKGYRLHTITTASAYSTGFAGGDRIQATMVFEKI